MNTKPQPYKPPFPGPEGQDREVRRVHVVSQVEGVREARPREVLLGPQAVGLLMAREPLDAAPAGLAAGAPAGDERHDPPRRLRRGRRDRLFE